MTATARTITSDFILELRNIRQSNTCKSARFLWIKGAGMSIPTWTKDDAAYELGLISLSHEVKSIEIDRASMAVTVIVGKCSGNTSNIDAEMIDLLKSLIVDSNW